MWLEYRKYCVTIFLLHLVAKWLDGAPATNKSIDIVINNRGRGGKYSKSYVTDVNGEVKFSIPPAAQDLVDINIQVCTGVCFLIL